jgi:hypothetical protein
VVFVGHLHAYARSRPRHGVVYVAVGTGGATLDVALREARFSYETVDGRARDHFPLTCCTATLPRPRSTP